MNPHVSRIHVDEDSDVTKNSDAVLLGCVLQLFPLLREGELQNPLDGHCADVFRFSLRQRLRIAAAQRFRPLGPCAGLELSTQNGIKRVVVEPGCLIATELLKIGPLIFECWRVQPTIEKIPRGLMEQRQLPRFNLFKIDSAGSPGQASDALAFNPAPVGEKFQADERGFPANADEPA